MILDIILSLEQKKFFCSESICRHSNQAAPSTTEETYLQTWESNRQDAAFLLPQTQLFSPFPPEVIVICRSFRSHLVRTASERNHFSGPVPSRHVSVVPFAVPDPDPWISEKAPQQVKFPLTKS
ncbi:hypothetical protein AVEN_106168-1 [Araneus ventricosus]|uniref:Uncharacterized protein n=1 Tax=Araneus ventricosus TaxID=182803 RepID=A0A4Y2MG74_ARAVE|nr:hypothetical protein AVEN_106168-1 [Araneus ventricosus]